MKKILFIVTLLVGACTDTGSEKETRKAQLTRHDTITDLSLKTVTKTGLSTPESVVAHKNAIYVANIGGNPTQSPKKGFITKIQKNKSTNLFTGLLDDPKGFAFLNDDIILVSDHPNVKLLKISTGEVLATLSMNNPGFLNDLVLVDEDTALVSDTGKGLVYKIEVSPTMDSLSYTPVAGISENGINGLAFNSTNNTLYFITSTFGGDTTRGHIFETTLSSDYSKSTNLTQWDNTQIGAGGLDGLELLPNNQLILSDWGDGTTNQSSLYVFNTINKELLFKVTGMMTSVADIDVKDGKVYLPEFTQNTLSVIDLSKQLKK